MLRPTAIFLLALANALCAAAAEGNTTPETLLRQNWAIQSSADLHATGAALSAPGFNVRDWYPATIPSTVVSALVEDRVYPDPYVGMNLRNIAGTSYPIGMNFSNLPMPPGSPYNHAWWYRTEFQLPVSYRGKTLWLDFDGINFRANVWLNGRQIASSDKMAGAWRLFNLNVTATARPGENNALAVEVFPPDPHDLAITFVDWNPMPPDKDMGLWRDVRIRATGPVSVRFPGVVTHVATEPGAAPSAALTIRAELTNGSPRPVDGVLRARIEGIDISERVQLPANGARTVRLTPDKFPQLKLANPRLWWPAQVGEPNLYPLDLQFEIGQNVSDSAHIQFGIREVTAQVDDQGHLLFRINGKNILIRGAGYSFDMLLRSSPEKQEAELKYVRDMNLNAIRLEGKLEDDHFLDLTDRYGILVMAGWCCCDHWERWKTWDKEDKTIATASLRDQIRRLERHPSVFDWMNGSDNPPIPEIERAYIDILKENDWPNPYQSSATGKATSVTGPTGVKMLGPYDYVPPSYWFLDTKHGGAYGFNTETGPGPAPPPIETLKEMLPADHLWPVNSWWDFHAGGGAFRTIDVFDKALDARYGKPAGVEEYARKAQVMAYETHRAMFEAFGRNKYTSTGVIQWMLNNAWPSMIWHLYDWYLRPGGSYFGTKKACEPLHVQYSYDDRSVVVVNAQYKPFPGMKVTARVYNLDMKQKFSKQAPVDVGPDSSQRVFTIPEIDGLTNTYFVSMLLENSSGEIVSRNFYWLSTKPDTLDWDKSTWYYTPSATYADYTALNRLPEVDLEASASSQTRGQDATTTVKLHNPSRAIAFAIHLKLTRHEDREVLPILWEDNYFPILPGETRTITATYNGSNAGVTVDIDGWNVKPRTTAAQ